MSKIKKVTMAFDEVELTGVFEFKIYYDTAEINDASPFIVIPVVAGQTAYFVEFPTQVPVVEGSYNIGVAALDEVGNESDMDIITSFFDFSPPAKPTWRK